MPVKSTPNGRQRETSKLQRETREGKARGSATTLAVDIGGTGIKMMILDAAGEPLTERLRVPTPSPATSKRVIEEMVKMRTQLPAFDQVSVGFPGVIKDGKTWTAANLDKSWVGYPIEATLRKLWKKPVRVCNDAAVQGFGAIEGKGVELVLTLGTGMGSALYTDGRLAPGLELAHHPWRKGKTYEDFLGRRGYDHYGPKKWNHLLEHGHRTDAGALQLGPAVPWRRQFAKGHAQAAGARKAHLERGWIAGRRSPLAREVSRSHSKAEAIERPDSRSGIRPRDRVSLLDAEVREQLRIRLIHREQVVAGRAVIGDAGA